MIIRLFLIAVLISISTPAYTNDGPLEFDTAEKQLRYQELLEEIRCLVCQNQSLADSSADLAGDLRREIYRMVDEDQDDEVIIDFLVSRYGEFVLYRPRFEESTWLLWFSPLVFFVIALLVVIFFARGRASASSADLTSEEAARLANLIKDRGDDR